MQQLEKLERLTFGHFVTKLPGVEVIEQYAFFNITGLIDVEFGEELETIGFDAFNCCTSLRRITIPSVK